MNYVIANWKTYLNYQESVTLAESLSSLGISSNNETEVVLCPPMVALGRVSEVVAVSSHALKLGAQDCFWENEGHITGELLPKNIADLPAEYVIVGHSERREHLGETNDQIKKKVLKAFEAGLNVILCIGESQAEREANTTDDVLVTQLSEALIGSTIPDSSKLLVAYEPIWAIYPSKSEVDPTDVEQRAQVIHEKLKSLYGADVVKEQACVIYGGSVDSSSIATYTNLSTISGALIGHASTTADEFAKMVQAVTSV